MLIKLLGTSKDKPVGLIAIVDEVHLLDKTKSVGGVGLGRLFLRTLRQFQTEWESHGLVIVPLGTGTTLHFPIDATTGSHFVISGNDDEILLSRDDYGKLATEMFNGSKRDMEISQKFPIHFNLDAAICDFYPQIRDFQYWCNNFVPTIRMDQNFEGNAE